jgi:hypothetical protein
MRIPLAVTRAATRKNAWRRNLVFINELRAQLFLVGGRLPLHVENLFFRPDEFLWLAMTLQAPLHLKRRNLHRERHEINASMTGRAPDAFVDVYAVVEIDEVGQVMHFRPLDGLTGSVAFTDGLKERAVGKYLRMTIHASLCRRNARDSRRFNRGVTIAAVYPLIADVMTVSELNGLLARKECLRVVG